MKSAKMLTIVVLAMGLMVCLPELARAVPMGTAFTYQGRLLDANSPAEGIYDAIFVLLDSPEGPNELGITEIQNFEAFDGYFTVELDFGSNAFDGSERWLQIYVRPGDFNDPCGHTLLWPRQKITPTPYALFALNGGGGGDGHSLDAADGDPEDAVYVDNQGNVGIGTTSPDCKLQVISEGLDFTITGNHANGNWGGLGHPNYGVVGENAINGSAGFLGANDCGVYGEASGSDQPGVRGRSDNGDGVVGWTGTTNKSGVHGWSDGGCGVEGESSSGYGVYGESLYGYGVYGITLAGYAGYFDGFVYILYDCSALSFTDRTPYPKDLETAYQAVMSMERLPDGQYDENNKQIQLDHSKLSDFIKSKDGNRNLSATVSALNEVVKDLIGKVEAQQQLIEIQNAQIQQMLKTLQTNKQQPQSGITKGAIQ